MSNVTKLGAFLAGLVVAFGAGLGLGTVVGPVDVPGPADTAPHDSPQHG